ncbi:MAG TPA: SRPBCC domain-containing protein [Anaerolineales bacterium]
MKEPMDQTSVTLSTGDDLQMLEVIHSTLIRADALPIYNALTTSEGLDAWFTNGAKVNPCPGGQILFRWENWGPDNITTEDGGKVLEAVPAQRFVFQWHPDSPGYATTVEINFRPAENGTIVCLREYGFTDTPSGRMAMMNCATGWGEALTLLKFYIEHGIRV